MDLDPVVAVHDSRINDDEDATEGYEDEIQQEESADVTDTPPRIPPADEWCSCGMCITMPTLAECYCCNESEIIESLRKEYSCVTLAPQFKNL